MIGSRTKAINKLKKRMSDYRVQIAEISEDILQNLNSPDRFEELVRERNVISASHSCVAKQLQNVLNRQPQLGKGTPYDDLGTPIQESKIRHPF